MIKTNHNRNDFTTNSPSDTFNTSSKHSRVVFNCNLEAGSIVVNTAFNLYCTAAVVLGDTYDLYQDSVITDYTGDSAWADLTGWGVDTLLVNVGGDTADTTGVFSQGKCTMTLKFTAGGGTDQRLVISDAFCTGQVTFTLNAITDTVTFFVAASGGTHETSTASFTVAGRSSGDTLITAGNVDTVVITFDGADTQRVSHTDTGAWTCTGAIAFKDNGGVQVIGKLFRNGVQTMNDTITVIYDGTKPRITKVADTSAEAGETITGSATATFYLVDTGSGFNGTGSCTLYWHVDSGANTNFTTVEPGGASPGTYVITGVIPSPGVDTKVGFWWGCQDDVGNIMDSTALDTVYLVDKPGTYTASVAAAVRDVVISEIMWGDASMEYIELFNTTNKTVNVGNWIIRNNTTSYTLAAGDTIPSQEYYLLYEGGAVNDGGRHYGQQQDPIVLLDAGDSIYLISDDDSAQIDSAPYNSGWPAGIKYAAGNFDTQAVSMERKLTGTRNLAAGSGDASAQWDSHTMRHGHGGRPHGTPGHANSINVPNITSITPTEVVEAGGRGEWVITVTNGPNAFATNGGRVILQMPTGWSNPGNTATDSGYTTVSVSNGSINSTSYSGQSVIVNLGSFNASSGSLSFTYGDRDGGRNAIAKTKVTPGKSEFQVFFDSDGTDYKQVGDSTVGDTGFYSDKGGTVTLVTLNTFNADTIPLPNAQSFFSSEYQITWTVTDSNSRAVYGVHVGADTSDAGVDTMLPDLSEYSSFTGFYNNVGSAGAITKGVSGWTNNLGQFIFTIKMAETTGINKVTISCTNVQPTAHTYFDSGRAPVPAINEIGWGFSGREWIEVYNPTHATQDVTNWQIRGRRLAANDLEVDFGTSNPNVTSLDPFQYLVIADATNIAQDSGGAFTQKIVDVIDLTNAGGETLTLENAVNAFVDIHRNDTNGEWHAGTATDYSAERIYPNRSGILASSWASSDSPVEANGAGFATPGRPNSQALKRVTSKFFDRQDTFSGKDDGQTDNTMDSIRVTFTLKIVSGDTQPYQEIGFKAIQVGIFDSGPAGDSSFYVNQPDSTNKYGTAALNVSVNSNDWSGTVAIYCKTPYGVPDTAYAVFDRGDSLGYLFGSSETNVYDTARPNALLVYVAITDSFSGVDSNIMPQYRWKIGTGGTYSTMANLTLFSADTYLARVDISSNTWAITPHDTIYWQVTWKDKAGNYDTSPNNNKLSAEYIDNTLAFDTLTSPTFSDTLTGETAVIRYQIGDAANDRCTVVIYFDTDNNSHWVKATLGGGDTDDIVCTPGGSPYVFNWKTSTDNVSNTTSASVRLRIEVWDGFDTKYDTSGYFGVYNPDTGSTDTSPQDTILLPADGETYSANVTIRFVVSSPDSTTCTMTIQYSDNGGSTWKNLAVSDTSDTSDLYAPTFGDTKIVVWRSKNNLADTLVPAVRIRVMPNNAQDTGIGDTTLRFGIDNEEPAVLSQCTAVAIVTGSNTGVYVFWPGTTATDSKGYNVYRSPTTDSRPSSKINTSVITDTIGFKDSSVVQGDTFYFYVTVVDTYNNESDSSEILAAPNLYVFKAVTRDSSNPNRLRPGDTIAFQITLRNNGFAPAEGLELFDYEPAAADYTESATASSVKSSWLVHYRVAGASGADVWQSPLADSATMVRFTRANRMDPSTATASDTFDTLTIRVKIQ